MILGGITANELDAESGRASFSDSPTAVEKFEVAWDQAMTFIAALEGYTYTGGAWVFSSPATHPFLGNSWYCLETAIQPLGAPTSEFNWEKAIVTATYKPLQPNLVEDSMGFSGQMVMIPKTAMVYSSNASSGAGKHINVDASRLVPSLQYTITQYMATGVPVAPIQACLGTLNQATFRGFAPGTMLYLGCQARQKIRAFGSPVQAISWTLAHKFMQSALMQYEFCKESGSFEQAVMANGGGYKFNLSDFTQLGVGT